MYSMYSLEKTTRWRTASLRTEIRRSWNLAKWNIREPLRTIHLCIHTFPSNSHQIKSNSNQIKFKSNQINQIKSNSNSNSNQIKFKFKFKSNQIQIQIKSNSNSNSNEIKFKFKFKFKSNQIEFGVSLKPCGDWCVQIENRNHISTRNLYYSGLVN
jgi:hypothetical protein